LYEGGSSLHCFDPASATSPPSLELEEEEPPPIAFAIYQRNSGALLPACRSWKDLGRAADELDEEAEREEEEEEEKTTKGENVEDVDL
jgi:hypothetical protein